MVRRSSRRAAVLEDEALDADDDGVQIEELEVFQETKKRPRRAPATKNKKKEAAQQNSDTDSAVAVNVPADYLEISIPDPTKAIVEEPIVITIASKSVNRTKRSAAYDRQLRVVIRQVHILALLTGHVIRSRRASEPIVQV